MSTGGDYIQSNVRGRERDGGREGVSEIEEKREGETERKRKGERE